MVESSSISITPAEHADNHRSGGSDPLTGDVDIDDVGQANAASTVVHNGAAPNTWTDLDLSAVVGAEKAFVVLEVFNNNATNTIYMGFRPKGNANEHFAFNDTFGAANKCQLNDSASNYEAGIIMCVTDASGFIQWKCDATSNVIITILGYVLFA